MAKVYNQNKGNEVIPRSLLFDNKLSDRARFVYCFMCGKPSDWEFFLAPMAKELGYSVDTLRKYLKELTDSGWITKGDQNHDEETKKFGCVDYIINSKPYRKKPDTEKTRDGKIPTQDNNSSINTPFINDNNCTMNSSVNKEEDKKRLSDDNPKNKRFVKPTIEQIQAYIDEKKLHFEAERFFDWYESKGWLVGKSAMKDWKAACRTWENMRKSERKEDKKKTYDILPDDSDKCKRFKNWMRENHTEQENCLKPLSFDGYMRLQREYGKDEVCFQLDYIDANIGRFLQSDIEASIRLHFKREEQ